MKRMQRVFGDLDALRYVDGRLDGERRAAFLSHLAEDPAEAARVATWSRQSDVLRGLFAGVLTEPVPPALKLSGPAPAAAHTAPAAKAVPFQPRPAEKAGRLRAIQPTGAPAAPTDGRTEVPAAAPQGRVRLVRSLTSVVLLLALALSALAAAHALVAGLPGSRPAGTVAAHPQSLLARAADAFSTYALDPVHPAEFAPAQMDEIAQWTRRRLGLSILPPDFFPEGWSLLGGRMVPGNDEPNAFFVFGNDEGERLALLVARGDTYPAPGTALDMVPGGAAMSWTQGSLVYVLVAGRSVDWLSRNGEALKARVAQTGVP